MSLPQYVSFLGHGAATIDAPYSITDSKLHAFMLPSDSAKVQQHIDDTLNAVQSPLKYEVICRHALLYFMYCARVTAQGIGWDADHEVGFLIPLKETGGPAGKRLVFWSPYIFIDSALGMVTGREIWGFRKTMGEAGMPINAGDPSNYWAKTTVFPEFGTDSQGKWATILEVNGSSPFKFGRASMDEILRRIGTALASGGLLDGVTLLLAFLEGGGVLRLANLKQLRAVESSTVAQYQSLVEIDPQLDNLLGAAVLNDNYTVKVTACASHSIVSDLGLVSPNPDGTFPVDFAFLLNMNWHFDTGKVLWSVP